MTTTISSREFNRDVSAAKRAAEDGPVVITDHGRRSHVLLTAEEFDRLTGGTEFVGDRLRMPRGEAIDLELPDRTTAELRVPEL
ncbi:type II toxin-antitoxin system Phd/YefM family antitoxin [Microbacterium immunditiarum]|uniref:Antitoxin n=1 Tax=Microbacterium immunditiarum TaxID=337480 RepID=A0A7Y9GPM3_9MICO|nr:type II toxin-antitoxin system Phd/YefM family antitoxin [Microbacterium immunditiarum]NYE20343.1 prevent-host-death family protein [Microbacterium immunditiarum]